MTKHANGLSDVWGCEADYEPPENPWILLEERRPEDDQMCLVYPGYRVLVYRAATDTFSSTGWFGPLPVTYWAPLPDAPVVEEEYEFGTLIEIFDKEAAKINNMTQDAIMKTLGVVTPGVVVSKVNAKDDGSFEADIEVPIPLRQLDIHLADEEDPDGNDS